MIPPSVSREVNRRRRELSLRLCRSTNHKRKGPRNMLQEEVIACWCGHEKTFIVIHK